MPGCYISLRLFLQGEQVGLDFLAQEKTVSKGLTLADCELRTYGLRSERYNHWLTGATILSNGIFTVWNFPWLNFQRWIFYTVKFRCSEQKVSGARWWNFPRFKFPMCCRKYHLVRFQLLYCIVFSVELSFEYFSQRKLQQNLECFFYDSSNLDIVNNKWACSNFEYLG